MAQEYLTIEHISLKDITRIFNRIVVDPEIQWNGVPCWIWQSRGRAKYGRVWWSIPPKLEAVHRLVYAWAVGPIPKRPNKKEMGIDEIDHMCPNTLCCNPVHLRLIPRPINMLGPNHRAFWTHCLKGHELTPDNIYIIQGWRRCRKCALVDMKEWRLQQQQEKPEQWEAARLKKNAQQRAKWRASRRLPSDLSDLPS